MALSPGERLAARKRQPGHDRTWVGSERNVEEWARRLLPDGYTITAQPRDLAKLYSSGGLIPELKIQCDRTGRYVYVEVKRQGPAGNAEERLYKLFTSRFIAVIREHCQLPYHPFVAVLCDELATRSRYLVRFAAHLEAGTYLCWAGYEPALLAGFLDQLRDRWLEPAELGPSLLPRCAELIEASAAPVTATPGQLTLL